MGATSRKSIGIPSIETIYIYIHGILYRWTYSGMVQGLPDLPFWGLLL